MTDYENLNDPNQIFNHATRLGLQGKYNRAIELFEKGLDLIAVAGRRYPHEAEVRSNFAFALYSDGRIDDAIAQMNKAALLYDREGCREGLHEAYQWLADVNVNVPVIGEVYAERALQLGRELRDHEKLAIDLLHMGQAKLVAGKYNEAVETLKEASQLSTNYELKGTLADALVGAGRPEEAIVIYEEQLRCAENTKDVQKQVGLLFGLADAHERVGHETEALTLLRNAYSLAFTLQSPDHQSQAANRLGLAYMRTNRLEEAARTFENGVDIARTADLWRIELSLLSNLGNVMKEMGDLHGAESILLQVHSKSRARGLKNFEVTALASIGNLAATQRQFDVALARYQEAADVANQAGIQGVEAACLDSLGITYSNLGKPERALEYHRRAARLHKELDQLSDQITDLLNLAQAYLLLNEIKEAEATMKQVQGIAKHCVIIQWQVPFIMGQVAARKGDWARAQAEFRDAILSLESVRSSLKTPAQQRQWVTDKVQAYQVAAEAAIIAGDGGTSIEFTESNRARFLQAILHRRSTRPAGVDEQTWLRYERTGDRLTQLRAHRRAGLVSRDEKLDQELRSAEADYDKAFAAIQVTGIVPAEDQFPSIPKWKDLAYMVPPGHVAVSLEAFSTGIGAVFAGRDLTGNAWAEARIIDTFTKSDLENLVFGDRKIIQEALSLHTPLDDLPLDAVGWALSLILLGRDDRLSDIYSRDYGLIVRDPFCLATRTITHVCNILGAKVWIELIKYLPPKVENVILIPSAGFNLLPIHAALLADGSRINEHFNISYSPSLTLLKQVREQPPLPKKALLGQVVNPTGDLVFSSLEAKAVARCKGYSTQKNLTGRDASVDTVIAMLKESDIFHYSGHAYFDEQEWFRSGLILGSANDGGSVLTLGTILDSLSSIRSKFMILSACETGQVELEDKLNDFLGLPGGFIVAGAKAVLATLWRIDDLASCLLLEKFFELMCDNPGAAPQALARAQQWMRTDLTVDYVKDKIESWRKDAPDRKQEKVLLEQSRYWRARRDINSLPFKDEIFWAAFYITGLMD